MPPVTVEPSNKPAPPAAGNTALKSVLAVNDDICCITYDVNTRS